jgi:3-oxoadipate enol-lactonase
MNIETDLGTVSLERVGNGPDIVFLHSLLSDRNVFAPIVPSLAADHRLNLVDLPGFRSTTMVAPDMDAYGDLVGALLRAGDFDPATTSIIGNGLGSFVGLAAAIRHGHLFNELIVAGCGAGFTDQGKLAFERMIAGVEQGGMEAIIEVAVRRVFPEDYLEAHPDQAEERRAVLRGNPPEAFINAARALLGLDYRSEASGVTNRTLAIAGTEDMATPPAMAEELAALVPGARLEIMQGIAHAPQLQDPDGFLALVRDFLS